MQKKKIPYYALKELKKIRRTFSSIWILKEYHSEIKYENYVLYITVRITNFSSVLLRIESVPLPFIYIDENTLSLIVSSLYASFSE